ncbi:MAG: hypothetical protein J5I90_05210 [Caldilineales bacterium]|nr:hypothetical protein [Caldilineales bacterium]
MNRLRSFDWRYLLRMGLISGGVALYVSIIGMVVVFSKRDIIVDVITLGQVLLFTPPIIAGLLQARRLRSQHANPVMMLVAGALIGLVASLPLVLLILLNTQANLRQIFVNITPDLINILTFDQDSLGTGILMLIGAYMISALAATIFIFIPDRLRKAIGIGIIVVLVSGLMSEFIKQIMQQFASRGAVSQVVKGDALTVQAAVVIFFFAVLISLIWSYQGANVRSRREAMSPKSRKRAGYAGFSFFGLFLLFLPWLVGIYLSEVIDNVGLYVLMGLGLNIAVGWAGLLDLGYVTNFAVGAYITAVLTSTGPLGLAGLNLWIVIPIAIFAAMCTGFILALPVLRMRGDYLAIATLGFGEIIRLLAISDWLKPYIGGAQGVSFIPKPTLFGFEFSGPQEFYYIILAACLFMLFVALRLNRSRTGRQWMAMREDEDAASAMGIDVTMTKLLAFTLSAASGGLAGAIFASKLGAIFAQSFSLMVSINVLSLIIVGGIGSIPGVILGAIVLIGLPELLREFAEFRVLIYGALLVVMMLVRPEGLWPSPVTKREMAGDEDVGGPAPPGVKPEMMPSDAATGG